MNGAIQKELAVLGKQVQAAAIPDGSKHTALWCISQLPTPYAQFCLTNESRYGDQITRLVQGLLKELGQGKTAFPEAVKLAASIANRFHLLHETLGLPVLHLKSPAAPAPRSRRKPRLIP